MSEGKKKKKVSTHQILSKIFLDKYKPGIETLDFTREEILSASTDLALNPPKNVGDVVYSFRYRSDMPRAISTNAPEGKAWIITGIGDSHTPSS